MDFPAANLPGWIIIGGWIFSVLALLLAITRAPWYHLRDSSASNVLLGACVILMVLWTIRATTEYGTHLHLLGAMQLTLMFGWPFAIIAMSIAMLGTTLSETLVGEAISVWPSYGLNLLLAGVLPVAFCWGLHRLVQRILPQRFFIYIFGTAFFGAALSIVLCASLFTAVAWAVELADWYDLSRTYLPFFLLLAFPEAFHTGLLMSVLVVYKPGWVSTFDDRVYLRN